MTEPGRERTGSPCALLAWKRCQEPVRNVVHLPRRAVDHAVSLDAGLETNRDLQTAVGVLGLVEQLHSLPEPALDAGIAAVRILSPPDRRDARCAPGIEMDAQPALELRNARSGSGLRSCSREPVALTTR